MIFHTPPFAYMCAYRMCKVCCCFTFQNW